MKHFIKAVTIPLCGVMLGLAALGNLLQSYSEGVRTLCGVLAGLLLVLVLLKLVLFPKQLAQDLQNPIMASVAGTFSMALMLLATYVKPLIGSAAQGIWFFAIMLHAALIVFFTVRFILHLDLKKVFASYYIVYVGIATASVTAPAFSMQALGTGIFWFGFAAFLATLVLVTCRYVKAREIPPPAQPLFCIYAAPASLCLAGYIQSVEEKSIAILALLGVLSLALYLLALVRLPGFLKLPFFPSYAAFTFPFVISATAMKQLAGALAKMGRPLPVLQPLVLIQTVIAVVLVFYTLARFLAAMAKQAKAPAIA